VITDRLFAVYLEQLCVEDADTSFVLDKNTRPSVARSSWSLFFAANLSKLHLFVGLLCQLIHSLVAQYHSTLLAMTCFGLVHRPRSTSPCGNSGHVYHVLRLPLTRDQTLRRIRIKTSPIS
jgi:hypothetical protein